MSRELGGYGVGRESSVEGFGDDEERTEAVDENLERYLESFRGEWENDGNLDYFDAFIAKIKNEKDPGHVLNTLDTQLREVGDSEEEVNEIVLAYTSDKAKKKDSDFGDEELDIAA